MPVRFVRPERNAWSLAILALACALLCCTSAATAADKVRLKYWEKWTGAEGDAMRALVDDFNRSQSRIEIEYIAVSSVNQKTLVAIAGGNPPDIAGLFAEDIVDFGDKGALTELSDWARGSNVDASRYLPRYWEMGTYGGKLLGVVSVPVVTALHWNKRLFREAGLDPERPPQTIAELDTYAERLTRFDGERIVHVGFLPSDTTWFQFFWPQFFGGKLWDGDRRILLDSPENRAAYGWVQGYARRYGVAALQTLSASFGNFSSAQNPFLSGKTAMVFQGVWMGQFARTLAPDLEWGAAPFPPLRAGEPPAVYVDADVLAIPRGSRHPREAFEFIDFVSQQAQLEKLCLLQQKNSPLVSVSEQFFAAHQNPYIRMFQELPKSARATGAPRMSAWGQYRSEIRTMFQKVWLLRSSPEQALTESQARVQRTWDRALERRSLPPAPWLAKLPFVLTFALLVVVVGLSYRERRRGHAAGNRAARGNASLGKGLLFFAPWGVGLLLFTAYPVMSSIVYSLCDYSVLATPRFVGLANYADLLSDEVFFIALKNTLLYAAFALPLGLLSAFSIALLLDAKVRGSSLYRTLVFLPSLTPLVASSMVWLWIYNAEYGVLNYVLQKLSFGALPQVAWLSNPRTALPSLVFMSAWSVGHTVVILLAAMQDVPAAVYEAADLDGASFLQKVRHITLPLVSPVLYFNAVMGVIGSLQVFSQPYIMTGGGPARATLSYAMYLYENAFTFFRMGYASAMAWLLFLLILGLTALGTRLGRGRVHYTGA